jgi:hypothetical protein
MSYVKCHIVFDPPMKDLNYFPVPCHPKNWRVIHHIPYFYLKNERPKNESDEYDWLLNEQKCVYTKLSVINIFNQV